MSVQGDLRGEDIDSRARRFDARHGLNVVRARKNGYIEGVRLVMAAIEEVTPQNEWETVRASLIKTMERMRAEIREGKREPLA